MHLEDLSLDEALVALRDVLAVRRRAVRRPDASAQVHEDAQRAVAAAGLASRLHQARQTDDALAARALADQSLPRAEAVAGARA